MIKFFQTADWHITLKTAYGKLRFKYIDKAVYKMGQAAVDREVDFIVVLGDMFDSVNPSEEERDFAGSCLEKLSRHVKVYVIAGNHDSNEMFTAMGSMDKIKSLGGSNTSRVEFILRPTIKAINGYRIYFLPHRNDIPKKVIKARKKKIDILFSHFSVIGGSLSSSNFKMKRWVDPKLLDKFVYTGLGDLHKPQPHYSGSIGRINFGERKDEKGYLFVTVNKKKYMTEFIKTADLKFVQLNLVNGQLLDSINNKPAKNLKGAIAKIRYKGKDRDTIRVYKEKALKRGAREVKIEIIRSKGKVSKAEKLKRIDYKVPFLNSLQKYLKQDKSLNKIRRKRIFKFVSKVAKAHGLN